MKNELMIFEESQVSMIVDAKGSVLFELYSTGMALGYVRWDGKSYNEDGTKKTYARKDRIDKIVKNAEISTSVHNGQKYLTEEQLYDFMLEADTDKCKSFRKWITSEVLPTIRKTGGFVVEDREEEFIKNYFPSFSPEVQLAMVSDLKKQNQELKQTVEEQQPKVEYHDNVLNSSELLVMTTIAKDLNTSARTLNNFLYKERIQYKRGNIWHPYSEYKYLIEDGYADYHTSAEGFTQLRWTQKGRKFIIDLWNKKKESEVITNEEYIELMAL